MAEALINEKDSYSFQRARVDRIVKEHDAKARVEFDETNTWIQFRIVRGNVTLVTTSGEWKPSELADKSDQWLAGFIKQLSGGKV